MNFKNLLTITAAAATTLALVSCAPSTESAGSSDNDGNGDDTTNTASASAETTIEDVDIDALLEAAQDEPALTVYDGTSKIEEIADNFAEHYGLEISGAKADEAESLEMLTREFEAGNVQGDVFAISDVPSVSNQLLADGIAMAWLPQEIADNMEDSAINPPVVIQDPAIFAYNGETHDVCPADNVWAFTDAESGQRLALPDPLNDAGTLDWFSQLSQFATDDLESTYRDYFGEEFEGEDVAEEFVAGLASNNPLVTRSSEEASEAVGATGQTDPPMGLISSAKFRNNDELGYQLATCEIMEPFVGFATPKAIVIASETASPNAAKLFVHWMYTQEGIQPQLDDGKVSTNQELEQPDDPANVKDNAENIFDFDGSGAETDWQNRENWSDLWRMNS